MMLPKVWEFKVSDYKGCSWIITVNVVLPWVQSREDEDGEEEKDEGLPCYSWNKIKYTCEQ